MFCSMKKSGLILECGAMRGGLFTAGVLDVFMEAGVDFDGVIGVSAGAAFGCNLKSRQPGRVLRYNRRFAHDPRYCSWSSLRKTRHVGYNAALERIDAQVTAGKALLICPDAALPISRICHDPETMQKVYDIGRAIAGRLLPKVQEFVRSEGKRR